MCIDQLFSIMNYLSFAELKNCGPELHGAYVE